MIWNRLLRPRTAQRPSHGEVEGVWRSSAFQGSDGEPFGNKRGPEVGAMIPT